MRHYQSAILKVTSFILFNEVCMNFIKGRKRRISLKSNCEEVIKWAIENISKRSSIKRPLDKVKQLRDKM